jgi:CheY-like chemotaxis protein
MEADRENFLHVGMDGYVAKPLDMDKEAKNYTR